MSENNEKPREPHDGPPKFKGVKKVDSAPFPENGTLDADVIIIGGGGSGIPAAVSAYENGAKRVVLLEKRERAGGNAIMARGIFGCETSILRQAMVNTDKDEIFRQAMRWHHYDRVNGKLLRAYINNSGDTIEWILSKGIKMRVDTTTRMNYNQDPTWHCVVDGNMALVMGKLFEEALEKGMQAYFNTSVTEVILENGKVTGVKANQEGKEFVVHAPSVIISTGGFLSNEKKVKEYFPYYSKENFGGFMMPNMGEGIALAEKAGAATEYYATLIREACAASDQAPRMLTEFCREPYHAWFNKKGRRFVEETAGAELQICTNALMMQPDMKAFSVFDDACMDYMVEHGFELAKADDMRGTKLPDLKEKFFEISRKAPESCVICDTLEELAAWIGCKTEELKEEMELYNAYCDTGYDKDFYKERRYLRPIRKPPYYAVMHMGICVDTVGPLRIDHETRLLNKDYDAIEGLFAAGVITSGWQSNDYCGNYLFGSALSYSINSGRIAGRNAAKHAADNRE